MKKENQNVVVKNQVILNLTADLQRLSLLLLNNLRGRCQIKFGMTILFNNGGFTLIELLVVVLIIGILAAVAVPQYQKAVLKARFTQLVTNMDAIFKAQEVYYLANGTVSNSLENLDISVSKTDLKPCSLDSTWSVVCQIKKDTGNTAIAALQYFFKNGTSPYPGKKLCYSYKANNFLGDSICASIAQTTDYIEDCSEGNPCHIYTYY